MKITNLFLVFIMVSSVFEAQGVISQYTTKPQPSFVSKMNYFKSGLVETLVDGKSYVPCMLGFIPLYKWLYNNYNPLLSENYSYSFKESATHYVPILACNMLISCIRNSIPDDPENSYVRTFLEHPLALSFVVYSGYLLTFKDKQYPIFEKNLIGLIGLVSTVHLVIEYKRNHKKQIKNFKISEPHNFKDNSAHLHE